MERVEILAIETVLELGYFKEVESLELDVCLRESLTQQGLVLSQQVEGGFIILCIHDHLGIVATRYLRSISIHETG